MMLTWAKACGIYTGASRACGPSPNAQEIQSYQDSVKVFQVYN